LAGSRPVLSLPPLPILLFNLLFPPCVILHKPPTHPVPWFQPSVLYDFMAGSGFGGFFFSFHLIFLFCWGFADGGLADLFQARAPGLLGLWFFSFLLFCYFLLSSCKSSMNYPCGAAHNFGNVGLFAPFFFRPIV